MSRASKADPHPPTPTAPTPSDRRATPPRPPGTTSRWWWLAGVLTVALAVTALVAIRSRSGDPGIAGVTAYSGQARDHVEEAVAYEQTPPVGGVHAPVWQNCGTYLEPVPNETGVHSLEHGAVWITYGPDLPAAQVAALQELGRSQTYVLVSPYEGLPGPVVLSAWGRQLVLDSVEDDRFDEFLTAYRQGPDTPEPGAVCTNGNGTPQ